MPLHGRRIAHGNLMKLVHTAHFYTQPAFTQRGFASPSWSPTFRVPPLRRFFWGMGICIAYDSFNGLMISLHLTIRGLLYFDSTNFVRFLSYFDIFGATFLDSKTLKDRPRGERASAPIGPAAGPRRSSRCSSSTRSSMVCCHTAVLFEAVLFAH